MDFFIAMLWFSPCMLPVLAVASLFLVAMLRQAKLDAQRSLQKPAKKNAAPDLQDDA